MPNKYGEFSSDKTPQETLDDIRETFRKWSIREWDAPRTSTRNESGPAMVWFTLNGDRKKMSCSRFPDYARNLRAVYFALEGIRLASQRGILEQYKQFFKELPAAGETTGARAVSVGDGAADERRLRTAYEVLGITPEAPLEVAEAAYRALAKGAHPDLGGTNGRMSLLNQAIDVIKRSRGTD